MMTCLERLEAYPHPILGMAELAHVLGVSKQCLYNWITRGKIQVGTQLAMGPVWTKQQAQEQIAACRLIQA